MEKKKFNINYNEMINDILNNHNLTLIDYVIKYYGSDSTEALLDFTHQITIRHYDIKLTDKKDDNLMLESW